MILLRALKHFNSSISQRHCQTISTVPVRWLQLSNLEQYSSWMGGCIGTHVGMVLYRDAA